MGRLISALLCVVLFGAGSATKPTTTPSRSKPLPPRLRDDAPDYVNAWWDRQPKLREERKAAIRDELAALKAETAAIENARVKKGEKSIRTDRTKRVYTFPDVEAKRQALDEHLLRIRAAEDLLADMDNRVVFDDAADVFLKVGTIAMLHEFKVKQVVDATTAMIGIGHDDVWFSGVPTETMVDDREYQLNGGIPIAITGTTKYSTVTGSSRTILKAEVFRWSDYISQ